MASAKGVVIGIILIVLVVLLLMGQL